MLARPASSRMARSTAESIQLRHHDVRQHQGRPQESRGLQCLAAIRDRVHLISTAQQVPEVLAHVRVVIGHDDQLRVSPPALVTATVHATRDWEAS